MKEIDCYWQAMDGAMTKAYLGGKDVGPNPTDRAKGGVKRSLLTDTSGVPIGLAVGGANRHDKKLARETIEGLDVDRPEPARRRPQGLCPGEGLDFDEFRELDAEFGYTDHIRGRGGEARELKRRLGERARRWVVERTHSSMNRFRRILIRWEKSFEKFLAMLRLACALVTYGRAEVLE
jgi:transposase